MEGLNNLSINDISVSTHTFIAYTNLEDLDLESIFDEVKICNCLIHVLYKKKKKDLKRKKNPKILPKTFQIFFHFC